MIPGLLGTLASGFKPTDYSGCVLWLDASQINGLSNNYPVQTWEDKSGSGNNLVQSVEGNRPVFKTNVIGPYPVVKFDGSDDFLVTSGMALVQPFTVEFVLKTSGSSAGSHDVVFTGVSAECGYYAQDTVRQLYAGTGLSVNNTEDASAYTLATLVVNGNFSSIWISGIMVSTGGAGSNNPGDLYIGANNGSRAVDLGIAEFIMHDSALAAIPRMTIERYLASKYSLTIDQAPVNTVAGEITGTFNVGNNLSCGAGTWTNEPTTYAYQWYQKTGESYTALPGQTAQTLLVTEEHMTMTLRCGVIASNAFATSTETYSGDVSPP